MESGKYSCLEKLAAMACLTGIALASLWRLADPENIVINVIVGITAFVGGVAYGATRRATDAPPAPASPKEV